MNLDKSINNEVIYDTLPAFIGSLGCKVTQDADGYSKSYIFVHLKTEKATNNPIQ